MLEEGNAKRTVPREIEDSVVVVTGASGGIGRATTRIIAEGVRGWCWPPGANRACAR